MRNDVFLDTNILVYATDERDARGRIAVSIIAQGGVISVQVLNEFASVMRRKLHWGWPEIEATLAALRHFCPAPRPVDVRTHERALSIAGQTGYAIFDSLLVASALIAGCTALLTEGMQHGRVIDGRLTIRNPFVQ